MGYVDGFVLVLKKGKLNEYRKMANDAGKVWKRHGAIDYVECVGDDMHPKMPGKILNFPNVIKTKPGEKVVFSYITYKSRAHRDSVNKKVMKEMNETYSEKDMNKPMPFDMKRMAYGGFKSVVEL